MPYTTLLVDLDDTVYPPGNGMWEAIAARIDLYMQERLAIPAADIPRLRIELHAQYGTTLRGLAATRSIDTQEYLHFVHDLPVDKYLRPDPAVRQALQSIPLRKVIFTNADRAHAARVLKTLDLSDLFDAVIDINDIFPYCKPMPQAYRIALARIAAAPESCIFLDDAPRNLTPARGLGFSTILVAPLAQADEPGNLATIPDLSALPSILAPYLNEDA
jgi:putative hydrolase of the HAD superfamily